MTWNWNNKLYLLDQEGKITDSASGLLIYKGGTVCMEYFNFGLEEGERVCNALGFRRVIYVVPELAKDFQKLYPVILDEDRCTFGEYPACMFDMESGNFTSDYTKCLDHDSDIWITCSDKETERVNTCTAGMYLDKSTEECQECPNNFYSKKASFSCSRCPVNTVSGTGASSCRTCSAGHYWVQHSCRTCPDGYFGNGVECMECPNGTSSSEDNTMCIMQTSGMSTESSSTFNDVVEVTSLVFIGLVLVIVAVHSAVKLGRYFRKIGEHDHEKEEKTSLEVGNLERYVSPTVPHKETPETAQSPKQMLTPKPKPAKPKTPKPFLHPLGGKQQQAPQLALPIHGGQLKGKKWPRMEEQLYDEAEIPEQDPEDLYCDGYGL